MPLTGFTTLIQGHAHHVGFVSLRGILGTLEPVANALDLQTPCAVVRDTTAEAHHRAHVSDTQGQRGWCASKESWQST